jgi:hypothetical protein
MGVDLNAIKSFKLLKESSISLGDMVTLGRQKIYAKPSTIKKILKNLSSEELLELEKIQPGEYAEGLLNKVFQASKVDSLDYSDYEGASIVSDMNCPLGENLKNKYDLVFDGGTLEHVFNFPVAIKNAMEMLKVGGHFLSITCGNNLAGHGFYQFSPELFFRIFSEENGFEIVHIFLAEKDVFRNKTTWYKVKDPEQVRARTTLRNSKQTEIIVLAKKIKVKEIFTNNPYQSDYLTLWSEQKNVGYSDKLSAKIWRKIKALVKNKSLYYNPDFFTKVEK